MNAQESKKKLRVQMLDIRTNRSDIQNEKIKQGIYKNVKSIIDKHKVIFIYLSTDEEIKTDDIINYAISKDCIVCVPKCTSKGIMKAYEIKSLDDTTVGKFSIREPLEHCKEILPQDIDLNLIPCLCADKNFNRLGYGGGYYDRFLPYTINAKNVILCASECIVDDVFPQNHDIKCDMIVTDEVVYEK